jgi:N-acetyl-alpha-D-glucosaminyl L-malate synthase BshA
MSLARPLRIGITCYPSVGGSGILASSLGQELAARGHEVHFISYERPFRIEASAPRIFFHPVIINDYGLFKYPDYTLPLSVKMAEVSAEYSLDVLHVHYAVPHATAAILARSMLPEDKRPRIVATLHGTDTTLLGRDPGYGPAIRHALAQSDATTTVSEYLKGETERHLRVERPIEVIYNFSNPRKPSRAREDVRRELGISNETLLWHASNLRPVKRIGLLLETLALLKPRQSYKLLLLAGDSFKPFAAEARRLGVEDRIIVREKVEDYEDLLQAADVGLFTSESESFCLSILEAMFFGCPSVATKVGGIPEVVEDGVSGVLVPSAKPEALATAVQDLATDSSRRRALGNAARKRAQEKFSANAIVPLYEALYQRLLNAPAAPSAASPLRQQ